MKRIAQISLVALGLALATQAAAQSGGGTNGGHGTNAPAQPDPRYTPTQADRQAVSPAYYINHGDYASAAALQAALQDASRAEHSGAEIGQWESVIRTYDPNTSLGQSGLRILTQQTQDGPTGGQPGAPGSRPVGNYERQQTDLLTQRSQTLGNLLSAANTLVEITGNASPAAQAAAAQLRDTIREYDNNLQTVLRQSRTYDGRSFPNDAAAQQYLLWRSIETAAVQRSGDPNDLAAQFQAQLKSSIHAPGGSPCLVPSSNRRAQPMSAEPGGASPPRAGDADGAPDRIDRASNRGRG